MLPILLFGHEHNRYDRENWINVSSTTGECNGFEKNPTYKDIKLKFDKQELLYDYRSCSHDQCTDNKCMKILKKDGVNGCGCTNGLSVLDIDKINAAYDCKGCHGYRWKHVKNVDGGKEVDGKFGSGNNEKHICRAFSNGAIVIGEGNDTGCHIIGINIIDKEYEILTNQNNASLEWIGAKDGDDVTDVIKGGRKEDGTPLFIARCEQTNHTFTIMKVSQDNGKLKKLEPENIEFKKDCTILKCRNK